MRLFYKEEAGNGNDTHTVPSFHRYAHHTGASGTLIQVPHRGQQQRYRTSSNTDCTTAVVHQVPGTTKQTDQQEIAEHRANEWLRRGVP